MKTEGGKSEWFFFFKCLNHLSAETNVKTQLQLNDVDNSIHFFVIKKTVFSYFLFISAKNKQKHIDFLN